MLFRSDEENNTDTKIQKINGVSKPKVNIEVDEEGKHFVVIASDDEKLSQIEFKLNQDDSQVYALNLDDMNLNEIEYKLPMELEAGDNILEVTVHNSNGITEYVGVRVRK